MSNTPSRPPPTSRSTTLDVRKLTLQRNKTTVQARHNHLFILPPLPNSIVPPLPMPLMRRLLPSYQGTVHRRPPQTQRIQHSLPNTRPPNNPPLRNPNTPPTRPRLKHTLNLPSRLKHPTTPTLNKAPPPLHQGPPPLLEQPTQPDKQKCQWDSTRKVHPWEWRI